LTAVALALFASSWIALHYGWLARDAIVDTPIYEHYGDAMLRGDVPYRDFAVEYPPVMVAAIEVIDGGSFRSTTVRLMWSQLVVDLAIAGAVAWGWGRRAGIAYLVLGLPFLLYPFLYLRLDLLSVFLAVLGVALVRKRYPAAGGATLAVACFAKLWPLVLVPVLVVRRAWRALGAFVAVGAAGTAAWVAWAGTDGPIQVVTFRGARGWEFESTVGALVRSVGGVAPRIERGAWRVGEMSDWTRNLLTLALLAAVVLVWFVASRAKAAGPDVLDGLAPVAAVVAFLVLSPLLSPQFFAWVLPFAAIAAAHREQLVAGMTLVAISLSVALLALLPELIHGGTLALFVLALRNAVLIALLAVVAARLVRATGWRRAPARLEPATEIAA
jgi:hypothetical protein